MSQSKKNNDKTIIFSAENSLLDNSKITSGIEDDKTVIYSSKQARIKDSDEKPDDDKTVIYAPKTSQSSTTDTEEKTVVYSLEKEVAKEGSDEEPDDNRTVIYAPEISQSSTTDTEDKTVVYSPEKGVEKEGSDEEPDDDRTVIYAPKTSQSSTIDTEDKTVVYSPEKEVEKEGSDEEPDDKTVIYAPEVSVYSSREESDQTVIYTQKEALENHQKELSDEDRTVIYSSKKAQLNNSFLESTIADNVTSIDLPKVFQSDATIIRSSTSTEQTVVTNTEGSLSDNSLQIGSILKNRFVLKKILGRGGMGTVFRATDLRRQEAQDQQSDVAIKVLNNEFRDDPELFIALQREAKKSQLLAHPNIVTVYDFDRDGNNVFMVMELLKGKTLSQFIQEECANGLAFKKAFPIIKGLGIALAYAHKKNIIHSDFKPGNVFITDEGEVKVLDFGIACAVVGKSDLYNDETVFNARDLGALTPAYASLEMLLGKSPDPSDDVYALACVCYEILTGKHPYAKLSAQKALEVNLQVPLSKNINRRSQLALNHALVLRRENRTATVTEFLDEIEQKSIWPKIFITMAIVAVLSAAAGYYYVFYELKIADDEIIELSNEQVLAVKDFLELADIHFEVGFLTAPPGSNALWAFKQVLAIDPYNQAAQKGLKKIAGIIEQQAQQLYQEGKLKDSLAKIEEGLEAVPKYQSLLELKDKILEQGVEL